VAPVSSNPSFVVRGDLGTALAVDVEPPGGGGEDAWLAGHVGPAGDRLVSGAQGGVRWKTVEWPVGGAMET